MWKSSIDMLPFLVKKEPFFSVLVKETGQALIKEGTQTVTKEISQAVSKEVTQVATKEAGEALVKETTQALLKEATQASSKEAAQQATKEVAQKALSEAAQSSVKKATSSSLKKVGVAGLGIAGLYASSQVKTDTNGDGKIDENDKSILEQASAGVGKAVVDVGKEIVKPVAEATGGLLDDILKSLGIDLAVWKENIQTAMKWILYIIAVYIVVQAIMLAISVKKSISGKMDLNM